MMEDVREIELDRSEIGMIVTALNDLSHKYQEEGKDTTFIDETILKILNAPNKKRMFKKREKDER